MWDCYFGRNRGMGAVERTLEKLKAEKAERRWKFWHGVACWWLPLRIWVVIYEVAMIIAIHEGDHPYTWSVPLCIALAFLGVLPLIFHDRCIPKDIVGRY